jgi:hypothetical protein
MSQSYPGWLFDQFFHTDLDPNNLFSCADAVSLFLITIQPLPTATGFHRPPQIYNDGGTG